MKSIALMAVAGLATVASAQSASFNLSFDKSSIAIGETATATFSASFTGQPSGAYVSSVNVDLLGSGAFADASNVSGVDWNNAGLGFDGQGTASGADVLGVEAAQFSLIPPVTAGSPIVIMTFTVTGTNEGDLSYSAAVAAGAPTAFSVTGGGFADPSVNYGTDAFSSGSLTVTPAPSAMALLGLGGLVAGRRRR